MNCTINSASNFSGLQAGISQISPDQQSRSTESARVSALNRAFILPILEDLIELYMPYSRPDEVEHAALFKKDSRAVKTLMLSDVAVVMADQGFCEITDTAKEG